MDFIVKWIVIIFLFGGFVYYMKSQEQEREMDAQAKLAPYNAELERYLLRRSVAKARIPARGNVIFVDEKTRRVDKFADYTISPYNQPNSPNDVDSVVLHNCEYEQVGSYANGSKALQQVCSFTVIDVASGAWSKWGELRGSIPPEEIKRKRGSTADETGGRAIYSFFSAGGLVTRRNASE